jgi:hypothetical protein
LEALFFDTSYATENHPRVRGMTWVPPACHFNERFQRLCPQHAKQSTIAMAAEKNARTNAGFQKLLQIGTVVAAKIGAGDESQAGGGQSPLGMLIGEFYNSLRPDQMGVLMQSLDMAQKIMFMEIVNLVRPQEPKGDSKTPGGASGAPAA